MLSGYRNGSIHHPATKTKIATFVKRFMTTAHNAALTETRVRRNKKYRDGDQKPNTSKTAPKTATAAAAAADISS